MSHHGDDHNCQRECQNHACHLHDANPSARQTLDELDFEKGIWNSAVIGDIDEVKRKLIRSGGADVNKVDKSGYTALHYACRHGHLLVCQTLLDYQANVNVTTQSVKATPLHRAAYMGHSKIVSLLLEHKADPSSLDCDGMTPLHKAAENGHIETIEILLRASPDAANIRDHKSRKPIDLAKYEVVRTAFSL